MKGRLGLIVSAIAIHPDGDGRGHGHDGHSGHGERKDDDVVWVLRPASWKCRHRDAETGRPRDPSRGGHLPDRTAWFMSIMQNIQMIEMMIYIGDMGKRARDIDMRERVNERHSGDATGVDSGCHSI